MRICLSNYFQVMPMQLVGDHTSRCSCTDLDNACVLSLNCALTQCTCKIYLGNAVVGAFPTAVSSARLLWYHLLPGSRLLADHSFPIYFFILTFISFFIDVFRQFRWFPKCFSVPNFIEFYSCPLCLTHCVLWVYLTLLFLAS